MLTAAAWIQLGAGGAEFTFFFFFWSLARETPLEIASKFVLELSVYSLGRFLFIWGKFLE